MALDRTALATCALWAIVFLIHLLSSAFYSIVAYVYHKLPTTVLSADLKAFQLTTDMKYFPVVVAFHGTCTGVHLCYFLEMLIQSIRQRKWFFYRHKRSNRTAPTTTALAGSSRQRAKQDSKVGSFGSLTSVAGAIQTKTSSAWKSSFGYAGFFGVQGKHFTLFFLTREVIEATLQSVQAFKLSHFVPRVWVNRLAAVVVSFGCWSTPAI